MIPLKLQIKNFLSYGSELETINFEPYNLICLSGKNGHGKSALLDAITWAVWGQARKTLATAKADQGLLRLGQTQMMVCLDFSCKDTTFRIRREYMHTYGKPVANLDFGMFDRAKSAFIPLTGKTIRETQATIEKTLNLDYEAFTNSAFLRQGQSNEFSKKSPKERKEILASILALNSFETIKRGALEKIRQNSNQKIVLQTLKDRLEAEINTSDTLITRLPELQLLLDQIKQQEQPITTERTAIDQHKKILHSAYAELEQRAKILTQQRQKEEEQLITVRTLVKQWRSLHATMLRGIDLQKLEQQKQEIVQQLSTHQEKLNTHLKLKEQWLAQKEKFQNVTLKIRKEYTDILSQRQAELDQQCLLLEQQKNARLLCEQKQQELQKTAALSDQQEQKLIAEQKKTQQTLTHRDAHEKQFEKRKQFYHHWMAQGNLLSSELNALKRKHELVGHEMPSCPLCEQNLSASRRKFLKTKFTDEQRASEWRIARIGRLLKSLKEILIGQHAQHEAFAKDAQDYAIKESQLQQLTAAKKTGALESERLAQEYKSYETITAELEKKILNYRQQLQSMHEKTEAMIAAHQEYQAHQASLSLLEEALKALPYDATIHTKLNAELQTIAQQINQLQQVRAEYAHQEVRKQQIHDLVISVKQLRKEIAQGELALKKRATLEQQEKELQQQEAVLHEKIQKLSHQKDILLQEKGALESQLLKRDQSITHVAQTTAQLKSLESLLDDLQSIAQATGKDGVQALLIEQAIPEIEQEANQLLSKLTDNQTQLFIESLRDLKKGGTKETLDIKISDAVGIRPYEMFSGGEAFRIDFALRIAISKLLSRRAGATLQILIIDEGFGSQDEEGLAHIMDAIYKIQDDFSKIIIVSHLPSMKDQFPVHFVIEKGAQGSQVKVVEQG